MKSINNFFKQEEKKPISFASIEMRKSSRDYRWLLAITAIIVMVVAFIWFSK